MTSSAILFISDIHTHYHVINKQIVHAESTGCQVSRVIVLGDFGFFGSNLHDYFRHLRKRFIRPVSFIDGNHEDHGALEKLVTQYADVVEYLPRGSTITLGPLTGLCLGGTQYMDAASTPRGSEISTADIERCLDHDPETVGVILTHDCPQGIGMANTPGMEGYGTPGVAMMARLVEYFKPRFWFFGHHHRWFDAQHNETRFIGLPESWVGYVLMNHSGGIEIVEHAIDLGKRPWWKRWFGQK